MVCPTGPDSRADADVLGRTRHGALPGGPAGCQGGSVAHSTGAALAGSDPATHNDVNADA